MEMSEEHKRKISEAKKGKKKSPEHIAKLAAARRGKKTGPRPPEVVEKYASAQRGKKRRPWTEEERVRHLAALKEHYARETPEAKAARTANITAARRAKPHQYTPEQKAKMAESQRRYNATLTPEERYEKFAPFAQKGQEAATNIIAHTKPEQAVANVLDAAGIEYKRQYLIGYTTVDFYIPSTNTIIEANGCYWHGCPICPNIRADFENKRKNDARRIERLKKLGYTVHILWEHDLKSDEITSFDQTFLC